MRVAIFSDVHGNTLALDAVLADVERLGGVEEYWFLGDAASQGFDPAGSVKRLAALPGVTAVRGNTDHHSTADTHTVDQVFVAWVNDDLSEAIKTFMIVSNFYWTRGAVTAAGLYGWLAEPPVEKRVYLPDGTRVLLVHASPGTDEGEGILPEHTDDAVRELLAGASADLVVVGHTHIPLDRTVDDVRVWNPGSVSNPKTGDNRAMWTLLEAGREGYALTRQYATYDIAAMLERLAAVHQPADAYIRSFWMRG